MKSLLKTIILFSLLLSTIVFPQNGKIDSLTTIEFKWSNDFEYQTDYYFTNGFAFEVFTNRVKYIPLNSIMFPFNKTGIKLFSITLVQDIFTPKAKFNIEDQLNGDRPFAAYILLGFKKVTLNKFDNFRTSSELQIGIIGPAALGEEVQNGIHNNLPTSAPVRGWENQISNSLMINYSTSIEKQFYQNNWFDLSGISNIKLGLPFTFGRFGIQTKVGLNNCYPKYFEFLSSKKWQTFLTLSTEGSIIGYNATLQGGLFSESIYTLNSINRFVGYANIGLTIIYKKTKIEYVQHFNTPEFNGAKYHSWGYLLIKVGF